MVLRVTDGVKIRRERKNWIGVAKKRKTVESEVENGL